MDIFSEVQQPETDPPPPVFEARVISGFWRRIFSFVIDTIILGAVGLVIGIPLFDTFAGLGCWGRFIGFFVALLYFGVLNSSIGNGQTIGKIVLGVEVVNRQGGFISSHLSFLRYTILAVPFFLNGAPIPPSFIASSLGYVLGLIVFGLGGAIAYLYIFNRQTRQSLHDLACGTFVVRTFPKGSVPTISIWKPHLVIIGIWLVVVFLALVLVQNVTQKGVFPDLFACQQAILSSGKVHYATVKVGWSTSQGSSSETTYLSTNVTWKEQPASYELAANEVASVILQHYPEVMTKDVLVVTVTYGYDIGIASAWRNQSLKHSPAEWKSIIGVYPVETKP